MPHFAVIKSSVSQRSNFFNFRPEQGNKKPINEGESVARRKTRGAEANGTALPDYSLGLASGSVRMRGAAVVNTRLGNDTSIDTSIGRGGIDEL